MSKLTFRDYLIETADQLDEKKSSADKAAEILLKIIDVLEDRDKGNVPKGMMKMAKGIFKDYEKREKKTGSGSFSPGQAQWIWQTSVNLPEFGK